MKLNKETWFAIAFIVGIIAFAASVVYAEKTIAQVRNSDDFILGYRVVSNEWTVDSVNHKFGTNFESRLIPVVDDPDPVITRTQVIVVTETVFPTEVRNVKTVRDMFPEEISEADRKQRASTLLPSMTNYVSKLVAGTDLSREELRAALIFLIGEQGITE